MNNPFVHQPEISVDDELAAGGVFGVLSQDKLSAGAAHSIRTSMLAALVATGRTVATPRRFALGTAIVAPLFAIGAASAATGESPLEAPVAVLEAAAASVGIGGDSGEVRQDFDVRSEAAGDAGQPGSQPGNTANAPGLNAVSDEGSVLTGTETTEAEDGSPDSEEAVPAGAPEDKPAPHENGKGCDDVLFAEGEPPFASPGGPVGCEVGNSGEHRKNGAKQDDDSDSEEPIAEEATDEPADDEEDSPGGTSHGLGHGHDEEKPGNGNGFGHDKHDHEPNSNGHGPPGDGDDVSASEEPAPSGGPAPVEPEPVSSAPGNSGNAKGKNK